MRFIGFLVASTAILAGSAGAATTENWTIKVGTTTRNGIAYIPSGIANPPMILQLHGMNQDAAYQKNQAKWEPVADTGKFIVVFPNGTNKQWDISGTTDVNFMAAIIDTMYARYKIDKNRVYLSGFSMGGMFTYHAMNKMSDKIAAFAPCSGYPMGGATASSSRPVPILHIHGDADDVVNYSGVEGALSTWRKWNGCPTTAQTTKPYPANKPNSVTTRSYWGPCVKNGRTTEVVLLTNKGKGHWYSMDQSSELSSEEIWNFSKKYSLAGSTEVEGVSRRPALAARAVEGGIFLKGGASIRSVVVRDLQGRTLSTWSTGSTPSEQALVYLPSSARGIHVLDIITSEGPASLSVVSP